MPLGPRHSLRPRRGAPRSRSEEGGETPARPAKTSKRMRHVRQRHDRVIGFTYDEAAGVAHFSMYVPGTAGRVRKRATVRAASYDQAVGLWSAFRSRAAEGLRRPSPEAPTFLEFITDYFQSIEANIKEKTAIDYRYSIDRHLTPLLGALRLTEITSGVLNRLGASLKASGYAGATVNKYMTLAASNRLFGRLPREFRFYLGPPADLLHCSPRNSSLDVEGADRARSGVGEVISSAYRPGRLSPKLNRATVHNVRTQVFTRSHARSECGHRLPDKGGGCSRVAFHGLERARRLQGSEELYGARGGVCTSRWQRASMGRQRLLS